MNELLIHSSGDSSSVKESEMRRYFEESPRAQFAAEFIGMLRELHRKSNLDWCSPYGMLEIVPARRLMEGLRQRPELCVEIVENYSGLESRIAYAVELELQIHLIKLAFETECTVPEEFMESFSTKLLACYIGIEPYWNHFMSQMPWDGWTEPDRDELRDLCQSILEALLKIRVCGCGTPYDAPLISPLELMQFISPTDWIDTHSSETLAKINAARLESEDQGLEFKASDILEIATPAVLARAMDPSVLRNIFLQAGECLGFSKADPVAEDSDLLPAVPSDAASASDDENQAPPAGGSHPGLVGVGRKKTEAPCESSRSEEVDTTLRSLSDVPGIAEVRDGAKGNETPT